MSHDVKNANNAHTHDEKAHGSIKLYVIFAVILCLITFAEWAIFKKRDALGISNQMLVFGLLSLSLVKFVMVCGWYMHLRYDHKSLMNMLIVGMVLASATFAVLAIVVHPKDCSDSKGECFRLGDSTAVPEEPAPAAP